MTASDLAILLDENVRNEIERAVTLDPARVALSAPAHGALIATQVKYLQRARTKLPSYHAVRCILPPLAFEQSSSEETAALKNFQGSLCIDLTCGLGVDSFYLSRRFDRVIALEHDPVVAETARINFARLGARNIEVLSLSAEEFLKNPEPHLNGTQTADLIYVDPARRGSQGEKLFRLEDCSPDVVALMPQLLARARQVVVKASPLFDVEEAFRLFGQRITVEVVSLHDECKEVLIILDSDPASRPQAGTIRTTSAGKGSLDFIRETPAPNPKPQYRLNSSGKTPYCSKGKPEATYRYLLIPDVSLYKARLVESYALALGIRSTTPTGYCFADEVPGDFFGKSYPIRQIVPYQPKKLKSRFKSEGIVRCNLLKKDFPLNAAQIAAALGIREGGTSRAAFTCLENERYAILLDHD